MTDKGVNTNENAIGKMEFDNTGRSSKVDSLASNTDVAEPNAPPSERPQSTRPDCHGKSYTLEKQNEWN